MLISLFGGHITRPYKASTIRFLIPRGGEGGFSYANFIKLPVNGWFAHDVTVTMLVDKNKSICLLWVLNSIFMLLKILLF